MIATINIPILPHYAGDYRLEYDGKYIALHGKDRRYSVNTHGTDKVEYEEMVLLPVVIEIRFAHPKINRVTENEIFIDLNQGTKEEREARLIVIRNAKLFQQHPSEEMFRKDLDAIVKCMIDFKNSCKE